MKIFVVLFLLAAIPLQGCLWDRDTIREELAGQIGTVKTLVGWFNRYPPLFYEMRLQRVTVEIAVTPEKASLYDDAAVACDRLGNPSEAIAWMEKKEQFAKAEKVGPGEPSTRYKTLANLGTFHAHRWILATKSGENPSAADLEKAIELVTQAIEENPAAHFNREKYQLLLLQWLNGEENIMSELEGARIPSRHNNLSTRGYSDLPEGLLGLIRLGAAWQSPDIYFLLQKAFLLEEQEHPRLLANLRVAELLAEGRTFLKPEIEPAFGDPGELSGGTTNTFLKPELINSTLAYYETARKSAESRDQSRTAYLIKRLQSGRHPDSDPTFWKDWREPSFPELPEQPKSLRDQPLLLGAIVIAVLVLILAVALGVTRIVWRAIFGER